jgi:hypothetical protein
LEIHADRFCVHFHSDGSNNDFGFVLRAVGHVARFGEPDSASVGENSATVGDDSASGAHPSSSSVGGLNHHPWYLGQPPSRVSGRSTIERGWLAGVYVLPKALEEEGVGALMRMTAPPVQPPDYYPEAKTIDTLAMVRFHVIYI